MTLSKDPIIIHERQLIVGDWMLKTAKDIIGKISFDEEKGPRSGRDV